MYIDSLTFIEMSKWYLITTYTITILNILLLLAIILKVYQKNECPQKAVKFRMSQRIVGGRAVAINQFRFVAALIVVKLKRAHLQCGCSIISSHWVISAGHCEEFLSPHPLSWIYVAAGNIRWRAGKRHKVTKMIANEGYVEILLYEDTSLFKVQQPFDMKSEISIPLVGPKYRYITNSTATVIGWGYHADEKKVVQEKLYAVNVTIFSDRHCVKSFSKGDITKDMFCAGAYEGGRDACTFDSGGPIVQNKKLIGVVSWGRECGNKTKPGVYARMSYFIPWIRKVEKEEKTKIIGKLSM